MGAVNTAIYQKIIGQAIRFVLRVVAGYLVYIGVGKDDQSLFVEVTVGVLVPMVLLAISEGWSFLQRRTAEYRAHYALAANPQTTTMAEVDALVARRTPPAVEV